jgi:DNA polymerase III subunit gamma/tau
MPSKPTKSSEPTAAPTKQALYRTYRPGEFSEMVGQEHISKSLEEQVRACTVSHAYLFAGSRGLGKTSIARIFAKALGTTGSDLYEIDAASNNTVEDIRTLSENVYTLPFESKYKVYLLDEAHMLSKSAWNALLKTLEEPPPYVIFILATTELEKVPDTVLSRCQVFEFKKPTRALLRAHVTDVAKKEGFTLETAAADLVALLGDGSYRDALSVLQKVLSAASGDTASAENLITSMLVELVTGAPSQSHLLALLQAISEGNLAAALSILAGVSEKGTDFNTFLTLLLEELRTILLLRHAPELRRTQKTCRAKRLKTHAPHTCRIPQRVRAHSHLTCPRARTRTRTLRAFRITEFQI